MDGAGTATIPGIVSYLMEQPSLQSLLLNEFGIF